MHYQVHARNAAAMWEALSKGYGALLVGTEEVRIVAPSPYHALRAIVIDPDANRPATIAAIVETVLAESGRPRRVVEDTSGVLDLSGHGLEIRFGLTVMARAPGSQGIELTVPTVHVVPVVEPCTLIAAERILMAVFPPPGPPPDLQGRVQPPRVLDIPGWRVWLAYRDEVPAGAAYTFHDGTSLGVYQVATLPEHRGHGVARALMTAILRAYPTDVVTLSATDQGRSLYLDLDFVALSAAIWWQPSHTGDDRGGGLR
jgi:GNAT superfamily N-acetyltransferase